MQLRALIRILYYRSMNTVSYLDEQTRVAYDTLLIGTSDLVLDHANT